MTHARRLAVHAVVVGLVTVGIGALVLALWPDARSRAAATSSPRASSDAMLIVSYLRLLNVVLLALLAGCGAVLVYSASRESRFDPSARAIFLWFSVGCLAWALAYYFRAMVGSAPSSADLILSNVTNVCFVFAGSALFRLDENTRIHLDLPPPDKKEGFRLEWARRALGPGWVPRIFAVITLLFLLGAVPLLQSEQYKWPDAALSATAMAAMSLAFLRELNRTRPDLPSIVTSVALLLYAALQLLPFDAFSTARYSLAFAAKIVMLFGLGAFVAFGKQAGEAFYREREQKRLAGLLSHTIRTELLVASFVNRGELLNKDEILGWLIYRIQGRVEFIMSAFDHERTRDRPHEVSRSSFVEEVSACKRLFGLARSHRRLLQELKWHNGPLRSEGGAEVLSIHLGDWSDEDRAQEGVEGAISFFLQEALWNALKYGKPGTSIRLSISRRATPPRLAFCLENETSENDAAPRIKPPGQYGGHDLMKMLGEKLGWEVAVHEKTERRVTCRWVVPALTPGDGGPDALVA